MRWARFRRINIVLTVVLGLLIVAWAVRLSESPELFAYAAIALVIVNVGLGFWTLRAMGADVTRVVTAHRGAVAFATGISSWPGADRAERESVIVLVADRLGLSFRDHEDREALLVPADRIMSLELTPLSWRTRIRPFRVTTIDGLTVDFAGSTTPDAQVDQIVALRTALGRQAG